MPRLVWLRWIDAQHTGAYLTTIEEAKKESPCVAEQVGFLVHEDKEKIILADQYWPEYGSVKYLTIIPRVLIKKRRYL